MECIVGGCTRPAALFKDGPHQGKPRHGGKCHGHARRQTNGQGLTALRPYGIPPLERLQNVAIDLAEAKDDDDDGFVKAVKRLYTAAMRLKSQRLKSHKVQKRTEHLPQG